MEKQKIRGGAFARAERARLAAECLKQESALPRRRRRGRERIDSGAGAVRLVPVLAAGESAGHVEVALPDGTALRLAADVAPERLAALVAAIRGTC